LLALALAAENRRYEDLSLGTQPALALADFRGLAAGSDPLVDLLDAERLRGRGSELSGTWFFPIREQRGSIEIENLLHAFPALVLSPRLFFYLSFTMERISPILWLK